MALFGGGLFASRGLDVAQRFLMGLAGLTLSGGGGGQRGLRMLGQGFQFAGGGTRGFSLDRQIAEPFGQPPRRGGRSFGGLRESVPAPQIAFLGDKSLPGFQKRSQGRAFRPQDDANLVQPARERRWRETRLARARHPAAKPDLRRHR